MTNSDSGGKKVRIVCKGNSFYDQSGNVMLFRKDVVAEHPGFRINCEEMEVLLEDNTVGFGDHAKSAAPGKGRDASGIRRAVAMGKGSLIDLVRFTPKGNLMGKCGYAIYDGRTGDIELHDWPVVSNGTRVYRAKKKETIMTIRQNGNHVVKGEAIEEAAGKEGL